MKGRVFTYCGRCVDCVFEATFERLRFLRFSHGFKSFIGCLICPQRLVFIAGYVRCDAMSALVCFFWIPDKVTVLLRIPNLHGYTRRRGEGLRRLKKGVLERFGGLTIFQ